MSEQQTVEDRIANIFGVGDSGEPESAPQPQADEQTASEAPEAAQEADAQQGDDAKQPSEGDYFELTGDDGQTYQVPIALKSLQEASNLKADYTQRTQAAATLKRQAEDKAMYVEAREQIAAALEKDRTALREAEFQHKQLQGLDWPALFNANPGQASYLQMQMQQLKAQIDAGQNALSQREQSLLAAFQSHHSRQWDLAVQGARERIGRMTEADDAAMLKTAQDLGFTPEEIRTRFADPRILVAINEAMQLRRIKAGTASAVQAVQKAAPVVKPGAIRSMPNEVKQDFAFKKAMKAAPTSQEKAKLIEQRLMSKMR